MSTRKVQFLTQLHQSTPRDYFARMLPSKPEAMDVASKFDSEYWDGDRKHGYGGYKYDGRWSDLAGKLIKQYELGPKSSILDLGCGKAHLLFEIKKLIPEIKIKGLDISAYAIEHAPEEIRPFLQQADLRETPLPFADGEFDLVFSLNTLHNFHIGELSMSLREIERIGSQKYIVVESYRNSKELTNLQCWALTCASFYSENDWEWIFQENGYTGDYEFIFFT